MLGVASNTNFVCILLSSYLQYMCIAAVEHAYNASVIEIVY